jgi:two-component system, OmpR family, sensor histidine kinase RstB
MRRLYFRITLGVLAILFLSLAIPGFLYDLLEGGKMGPRGPEMLGGRMELIRGRLENIPPSQLGSELDTLRRLFNLSLSLVDSSDKSLPPEAFVMERGAGPSRGESPHGPPPHGGFRYLPLRNLGKVLIMGPMPDKPRPETKFFIILVSVILVIVGIAGFFIVAPVARNLRALETAASQFGNGNLDSRAPVKSRDSVGSVARQFNLMAGSIQQMIQRERQLLQSVSHELRTPIARIRFGLDMLSNGTQEEREKRILEIDDEISEIDQLVGELLDYNRLQSGSVALNQQMVSVQTVVKEVIRRLHDFRPELEIDLHFADNQPCLVMADMLLFRRAIQNLVANALRYAKSRVVIECSRLEDETIVEVGDDGPGVPPESRELIMKPFYRVDQSGSKESGGAGLGLAIVSRIIELHGGIIKVDVSKDGGALFITKWPDPKPSA